MAKQQIKFTLIDESLITYSFRVLLSGYVPALFESNPVMLLMHNRAEGGAFGNPITDDVVLPIGKWNDIKIENGKITAFPEFDDDDDMAVKVEKKVIKGYLNASSVAIRPIETSNDPALKLPGQQGPTITKWEISECSIVDIPACRNALAIRNASGKLLLLSDRDDSKKGDVLTLLKEMATDKPNDPDNQQKTYTDPITPNPNDAKAYSQRVKELMKESYMDLYRNGKLEELKRLDEMAYYDKWEEGFGREHPDKKTAIEKVNKEKVSAKKQPELSQNADVKKLMAKSWNELWLSGDTETLFKMDKPSFYAKYKEHYGEDHPLQEKGLIA
jgi:hypothetical protein